MPESQTEILPCQLTEPEISAKSQELAKDFADVDRFEGELDTVKKRLTGEIKRLTTSMGGLAREIREKRAYRDVEVVLTPDFQLQVMQTLRTDTGEVVRERPLTEAEKQRPLPLGGKPGAVAGD